MCFPDFGFPESTSWAITEELDLLVDSQSPPGPHRTLNNATIIQDYISGDVLLFLALKGFSNQSLNIDCN